MARIGLERARPAGEGEAGRRPGVQGIASNVEDILLRGERLRTRLGGAVMEGTLVRTIGGPSTLTIAVHDHNRHLLNSDLLTERHDLTIDRLPFRFVKAASEGRLEPLSLTYEARAVALLKALKGPHKAFRDRVTRAEFAKRRAMEARPRPRFICPQLHVEQPVKSAKEAQRRSQDARERRGKGIGAEELSVKGQRASAEQIRAADRALRVAESEQAPGRVMVALIAALIVESEIGELSRNWLQVISSTAAKINPTNLEQSARGFLRGYLPGETGAIEYFKANPDAKAYEIAQAVQRSGAGAGSNGASNYGPHVREAAEFVQAYGGGSVSTLEFERFAFEQGKRESNWGVMTRLAKGVRWRCFESAGWIYYIDDRDLLDSVLRMVVGDSTPGIVDTSFDYDVGKEITEVRIEAYARAWAAPPGSVVELRKHGPANGRYILHRIEAPLRKRNSLCEMTLRRPVEPLPEPPPESSTRSVPFGSEGAASGGAEKMIRWAQSVEGTTEGSGLQRKWASQLGYSASLPWCSIFLAYGLKFIVGISNLPANPAYSGAWIGWSGGERVNKSNIRPGDFVVYDWGDGGITDHVALYIGGGQVIGGNQSDKVSTTGANLGSAVAIIRPEY